MSHITTARRAISAAEKLSPAMRHAIRDSFEDHDGRRMATGRRSTLTALEFRGLISEHLGRIAELNDFGRLVHAVLTTSADKVLARAGRQDAAAYTALTPSTEALGKLVDDTRTVRTAAPVAYRAAVLNELHARALVDHHRAERGTVTARMTPHICAHWPSGQPVDGCTWCMADVDQLTNTQADLVALLDEDAGTWAHDKYL